MNDLRQLRHFAALAEHQHFARAAKAVNLSQPALSRSIQALESSLGCELLDRQSRVFTLTAHGQLVLEHGKRLLAGSLALKSAVNQLANLDSGELRVGAGPYPAARLVPRAISEFVQLHSRINVQLKIDNWLQLRELLLDDEIELFVADVREFQNDPLLAIEPLKVYPGVLFCRPQHPLLKHSELALSDLLDYPLAGTQLPAAVEHTLKIISGREQLLSVQCNNFLVLKMLVAGSDVISMAPWDVLADDIGSQRLAMLPLGSGATQQHSAYGIVTRAGRSLSPAGQAMQEQLRKEDQVALPLAPFDSQA